MRPLAPQGCQDEAQSELTTLLQEDAEVSDVGPRVEGENHRVPLCAHHHQLYLATLGPRKCSHLTCYHKSHAARGGVPPCKAHLGVSSVSVTPCWFGPRRRRTSEPRRRSPSSATAVPALLDAEGPSPSGSGLGAAGPAESRGLALPAGWRAADSDRMQPGCSVLVRLRLRHVGVPVHRWALFDGTVEAVDHMGASSSQTLGLHVPSLQVRLRVPSRCAQTSASWGSEVEAQQHYLESLLARGPPGGSAAASGVQVHELPAPVAGALAAVDA